MKYPEDFINKIICANNKDIFKFIPDKSIDCICTDPPYAIDSKGAGLAGKRQYFKEISNNEIDVGFDFEILKEYERILKTMNLITFCAKDEIRNYLNWCHEKGYRWKLITWHKTNPVPLINGNYLPDTEYIFHIWDGIKLKGNYDTKKGYYVTPIIKNEYDHPTVKPLFIIENLIINATDENSIILDPFCGSGTTLVACKNQHKNFIGIEISPKYVKIINERLSKSNKSKSLFD